MTGRKDKRRSRSKSVAVVVSGTVGAFAAAAAFATGSASPARADFDDLLDPIVQPIITSLSDSLAVFDPAAALDFTNWANELLDSLGSFDFATQSVAEPAGALAAASNAVADPPPLPITMMEGTEPTVSASINGGDSVPLLIDTGSKGLVIPSTELGDNYFAQLQTLFSLGLPSSFGFSGYSGGVDYFYLTYNSVPVDYAAINGGTFETDGPVNIETFSFVPGNLFSLFTNDAFQNFLANNEVSGILGIGYNATGPTISPFINYDGVLVDIPHGQLDIGPFTVPDAWNSTSGAPITTVLELANGKISSVSNNIDSGGVFGTIPSALAPGAALGSQLPNGVLISVYSTTQSGGAADLLYQYTTGPFNIGEIGGPVTNVPDGPIVVSGTSIDSGVIPFLNHEVYLDYSGADANTMSFSPFIGIATP